ncbi:MAG TPA: DUF3352 domain-containing protein [Pyrinomonadaceae bacterium]
MKAIFLLLLTLLPITTLAQQKRPTPARPQPKATPAPTPAPTFDTLLPADSYTIYAEVRGAGQLIRSNDVKDLLEPVLKLAGPPKEFKSVVKWLNAHADELMTSRLLVAAWPARKDLPQSIVAVEFASSEEAAKFVTPLNEFLPTVLPPVPEASPATVIDTRKPAAPPVPGFHLQRLGSLVLIAPKQWTMKQLKPAGAKLLSEDANFRTARNRFSSELVFAYIDVKAMEREQVERRKVYEAEQREEEERMKREMAAAAEQQKQAAEPEKPQEAANDVVISAEQQDLVAAAGSEPAKEAPTPDPMTTALANLGMAFFIGEADWPDAVALALSFEGDSIDVRGLLVNSPGEKSDPVPLWPKLIPAAAIAPESPNIFPADTELFLTMSLDLPQIYAAMSKPPSREFAGIRINDPTINKLEFESPFAVIESRLKLNIKDDLLPLLGSEIAIALPMQGMGMVGISGVMLSGPGGKENSGSSPVFAIEVRDKERLRALLPKLIESFGLKGALALAQTERREDTELVSFANVFAYAFVGDFLVLSGNAESTRRVVDSYLKHETLAADSHFKNYTRWQPRQLQGQIYISPSLMESLKTWATQPNSMLSEQTKAFLMPAGMLAQPVTYSLSNEGNGPLHELHLPKNLVLMAVAGISGESNPPPTVQKERMAISVMYTIAVAEHNYKQSKGGSYGTLEQLIAENLVSKEMIENSGYRFEITSSGDNFEISAAPLEYGKTGKMSYYMDNTRMIRGADRSGAPATASDPPIQ